MITMRISFKFKELYLEISTLIDKIVRQNKKLNNIFIY